MLANFCIYGIMDAMVKTDKKVSLKTPRYGKALIADYLRELAKILAYSKTPLRSEKATRELFESRKNFVAQGAHFDKRKVSVYKVIRQKIKHYRSFLKGQEQRRQANFYEALIAITETFLDKLYHNAKLHKVEHNGAMSYVRDMDRIRRRASKRSDKRNLHLVKKAV